jgi:hypothetical protein
MPLNNTILNNYKGNTSWAAGICPNCQVLTIVASPKTLSDTQIIQYEHLQVFEKCPYCNQYQMVKV